MCRRALHWDKPWYNPPPKKKHFFARSFLPENVPEENRWPNSLEILQKLVFLGGGKRSHGQKFFLFSKMLWQIWPFLGDFLWKKACLCRVSSEFGPRSLRTKKSCNCLLFFLVFKSAGNFSPGRTSRAASDGPRGPAWEKSSPRIRKIWNESAKQGDIERQREREEKGREGDGGGEESNNTCLIHG